MNAITYRLLVLCLFFSLSPLKAGLWSGAYEASNGWKYLPWFGWFWSADDNEGWIYKLQIGWMYAAGTTQENISLYMGEAGTHGQGSADDWFLTGSGFFPGCYSHTLQRWYVFDMNSLDSFPFCWWDDTNQLYVPLERIGYEISTLQPLPSGASVDSIIVFMRHGARTQDPNDNPPAFTTVPETGALTTVGQQEAQCLGAIFQNRLITQTQLLPQTYSSSVDASIYSMADDSNANRCEDTAEFFLMGLYSSIDASSIVNVADSGNPYFGGPPSGSAADTYLTNLSSYIDEGTGNYPSIAYLHSDKDELANEIETTPGTGSGSYASIWGSKAGYSGPLTSFGPLYNIGFDLQYLYANNESYPNGFTNMDIDGVWSFFNRYYNIKYASQDYSRLDAYGPLQIIFTNALEGKDPSGQSTGASFFLFCGHDGDIWPIIGAFNGLMPAPQSTSGVAAFAFTSSQNPYFTSFLEITVFTMSGFNGLNDGQYVALNYSGKQLDLTSIGGEGVGGIYVPLDTFKTFLTTTPVDPNS